MKHLILHSLLLAFSPLTLAFEGPVPIPHEVFDQIRDEYPTNKYKMKPERETVEVYIKGEKSFQRVKLGTSQETLDLASYVDNRWKKFEIGFVAPFELTEHTQLFFINRYKGSGDEKGLPCGKAVKIKGQLDKLFTTQGINLMTKDGAYLNLLGGDFLLTQLDDQRFRIIYFKITDSRWSQRLCKTSL